MAIAADKVILKLHPKYAYGECYKDFVNVTVPSHFPGSTELFPYL